MLIQSHRSTCQHESTFVGLTFSNPFNTSITRVSMVSLVRPAAAAKPARQGIGFCIRGAANAIRGRAKLRAAKRTKDMIFGKSARCVRAREFSEFAV